MQKQEKQLVADENGRVFHMWEPLRFTTPAQYDYLRDGAVSRTWSKCFRFAVKGILTVLDKVLFGIEYEGLENLDSIHTGAVTVCNHMHQMDCTFIDHALGMRKIYFITLEENFKIPVIRHIVRWLGGVPLPKTLSGMRDLFSQMAVALRRGDFVQIYPEGIMYPYHRGLRPFKNGAFHLAADNGAPILPMIITQHKPHGFFRIYKRKPCLKLTVLAPICPDRTLTKRDQVADLCLRCREAMQQCLEQSNVN